MRKEEGRKRENGEKQIIGLSADEGEERKKKKKNKNRTEEIVFRWSAKHLHPYRIMYNFALFLPYNHIAMCQFQPPYH